MREKIEPTLRKSLPAATRIRVLSRTGMQCARAKCRLWAEEIDHIIPVWMGGADDETNMEGLCVEHHKIKTRLDAVSRAKAKRLIGKNAGLTAKMAGQAPIGDNATVVPEKRKRIFRSRGFEKRMRRLMNGKVEVRT
jgi:hypothetical protein